MITTQMDMLLMQIKDDNNDDDNNNTDNNEEVCLFNGCITSQQHASVSQGRICSILRAATLR